MPPRLDIARVVIERDAMTGKHVDLVRNSLLMTKQLDVAVKRARAVQGDTLCSIVDNVEKLRVRNLRGPRRASAASGSSSASSSSSSASSSSSSRSRRRGSRSTTAARTDPCESPDTLRKLIQCMKACCTVRQLQAQRPAQGQGSRATAPATSRAAAPATAPAAAPATARATAPAAARPHRRAAAAPGTGAGRRR